MRVYLSKLNRAIFTHTSHCISDNLSNIIRLSKNTAHAHIFFPHSIHAHITLGQCLPACLSSSHRRARASNAGKSISREIDETCALSSTVLARSPTAAAAAAVRHFKMQVPPWERKLTSYIHTHIRRRKVIIARWRRRRKEIG